ncbi:MAG: sulfotransferase [Reichenbachiella sp.]|uniref:sulfotransferase family protein n=2 Tax=Reichenbachiella sp. TaxID=2184521 RepID=UPI003267BEBA
MKHRKYTPIQIIGTQRSGSNLLRLMLNELDDVSAPHPPHILKTFVPLLSRYEDISADVNFQQLISDVCQLIQTNPVVWEKIELDEERIYQQCENRTLVEVFRVVYELMAEANGATHWCCKSMGNVKFTDELESSGMQPMYIRLVRDGRDVAASFKKVAVGEKHVYHLAHYWKNLQSLSKKLVDSVGHSRAITISYEELIREPEQTMKGICDFLQLPYTSKVLNYFDSVESLHTAESGFMWQNVKKPILSNNSEKYRKILSKEEIEIFEAVAADVLEENGYTLSTGIKKRQFSTEEIDVFDKENIQMKQETLKQAHLRIDLSKRHKQEIFINSIKNRKLIHTPVLL